MPARPKGQKLNDREKIAVEEYLIDLNKYRAYIAAGYSDNKVTARAGSARLFARPHVQAAVMKALNKRKLRTQIDQDRVLIEESFIAFADPGDYFDKDGKLIPVNKLPAKARRALASVKVNTFTYKNGKKKEEVEYKFWDKGGSLKRVGTHLGMFPSIHRHTGADGGPIEWSETPMDIGKLKEAIKRVSEEDSGTSTE